ncbi:MAG: TonB family protein [Luteolibacter sp.]
MKRQGLFEIHESPVTWLPAIAFALLFHAAIVSVGYWKPHDHLLDLISQGEQRANDPPAPAAEEVFDVAWSPEQSSEPVPETQPEPIPEPTTEPVQQPAPVTTTPEFIEPLADKIPEPPPVEKPKEIEPPKIAERPKPKTSPAPPQKPKPAQAKKSPSPPSSSTPRAMGAPGGTGPSHSAGTNPNGKGDPEFAPSDLVVGNKNFPKPPYPIEARRKGLQGSVLLKISVASGRISNVVVIKSSGHPLLDNHASRFVKANWKFPAGLTRSLTQQLQFNLKS